MYRLLAIALSACALVAVGCGSDNKSSSSTSTSSSNAASTDTSTTETTAAAAKPATLRLMLDWVPGPVHSGIYYAKDKGLFDEAKLTVNPTKPPSSTAPLTFTAAGRTDLAIAYEPDLLMSNDAVNGKIKAVYALATKPLAGLWFGKGVGDKVQDLKGKTVGWFGIPYEKPMLQTALEKVGMSMSDIKLVNAGFNTNPALLSGKIDAAMGTYRNAEPVSYPNLPIIPVDELGVPTYDELVIIANAEKLKSDPDFADAVKRFISVMAKAVPAVRDDHAAALEAISKVDKEKDLEKKIEVSLSAEVPHDGMGEGCFDLAQWQTFADYLHKNKMTKAKIDASTVATNEYNEGC